MRWLSQRFGRTEDEIVTGFLLDNVPRLMAACTEGADEPEEIAAMTRWFAVARNQLAAPRAT